MSFNELESFDLDEKPSLFSRINQIGGVSALKDNSVEGRKAFVNKLKAMVRENVIYYDND